jgi:hypothetical protein
MELGKKFSILPGCDNPDIRFKGIVGQLETHLVIPLAVDPWAT